MSRVSGASGRAAGARSKRVLVLRRVGGSIAALFATNDGVLRVMSAEEMPGTAGESLKGLVDRHRPDRVVHLVPGSSAITRVVEMPSGSDEERLGALELIAEAQLPASMAWHRRGYGLLPERGGSDHHAGLICGWVGDRPTAKPLVSWRDGVASEAAALMWLLDPNASDALAVIADPEDGTISIAAMRDHRPFVRAVREEAGDAASWEGVVQRTLAESGLSHEELAWRGGPAGARLALDEGSLARLSSRVTGGNLGDRQWLAAFGPSLGAALAVTGRTPTGNLFALVDEAPKPRLNPAQRVAWALADRRVSVAVLVLGVLLCVAFPVVAAWARASVLAEKVAASTPEGDSTEGAEAPETAGRMVRLKGVMYEQLSMRRWPVMKLLSDIAGAMPVGVEAESIVLTAGDRISFRGVAESATLASEFISTLGETGVFRVEPGRRENTARGTEFDLSILVMQPFSVASKVEDFREQTLAVRLYGEEGAEMVRAALESGAAPVVSAGGGRGVEGAAAGSGGSRRPVFQGGSREEEAEPVPEALTAEAISKMDRPTTMREFGARLKAAQRGDLEDSVKTRLNDEVAQLRQRLQDIAQQGGGR